MKLHSSIPHVPNLIPESSRFSVVDNPFRNTVCDHEGYTLLSCGHLVTVAPIENPFSRVPDGVMIICHSIVWT